jgi:hypothetical protein
LLFKLSCIRGLSSNSVDVYLGFLFLHTYRGAQFEHEVMITHDGVEILTVPE